MSHVIRVGSGEGPDQSGEAWLVLRGSRRAFYDEGHSDEEDRFIAIGPITRGVIVVAYTERDEDVLRILSARMATKKECRRLEQFERKQHERQDS